MTTISRSCGKLFLSHWIDYIQSFGLWLARWFPPSRLFAPKEPPKDLCYPSKNSWTNPASILIDTPSATSPLAHTPMSVAFAWVYTQLMNAPSPQRNTLPEPPPPQTHCTP
ncbi:hypothetical protein DPMN_117673 [Dreissena polymorpha]|uniref:Uncharacterized protein n=1 Tax=Dreissena polymorpha TaxID=45954 RepID=A0A9D4GIP9_DREPO|nr:hypothetical protein DPMN_117673 [Dreissena polymorpha]